MILRINRWQRPRRWGRIGLVLFSLSTLGGAGLLGISTSFGRQRSIDPNLPRAVVRRADLHATVRAPGQVQSSKNTLIECEIEALVYANEGRSITAGGASTILSLIPDGSNVKTGDVICKLDASDYEELVRQQTIEVEESKAEYLGAQLDLEADEIRLREYREGLLEQLKEKYQGQIALAEADHRRQQDRVVWTERMAELKYLPLSRLALERQTLQKTQIEKDRSQLALSNLLKFTGPKVIANLQAAVESGKSVLTFRKMRLERHIKQLEQFREQVDLCTIKAPHDGFLIYANEDDDDTRIEEGARVRQRQDLFFLPDLAHMEVDTMLHESIMRRIRDGMQAFVRVEALPQARLEGHVVSVAPLPHSPRSWGASQEIKNFDGKIQLHAIPQGLLPGMTAEVEIVTAHVANALVIPPNAVTSEQGMDVCYVASPAGIQRRHVELGESTMEMIEVRSGLQEGEEVVLDPSTFVTADLRDAAEATEAVKPATPDDSFAEPVAQNSL